MTHNALLQHVEPTVTQLNCLKKITNKCACALRPCDFMVETGSTDLKCEMTYKLEQAEERVSVETAVKI